MSVDSKLLLGACQRTEHRPHVCVDAYVLADALPRTVARPLARTTTEQSNNCMALGSAGHGMRACCSSVRSLVGHCVCGARISSTSQAHGSYVVAVPSRSHVLLAARLVTSRRCCARTYYPLVVCLLYSSESAPASTTRVFLLWEICLQNTLKA